MKAVKKIREKYLHELSANSGAPDLILYVASDSLLEPAI